MTDVSGVASGRIQVATLNLFGTRAEWDARRTVVRSGLADLKPDLVSLQEGIKTSDYDQARDGLGEGYHRLLTLYPTGGAGEWELELGRRIDTSSYAATTMDQPLTSYPVGEFSIGP